MAGLDQVANDQSPATYIPRAMIVHPDADHAFLVQDVATFVASCRRFSSRGSHSPGWGGPGSRYMTIDRAVEDFNTF